MRRAYIFINGILSNPESVESWTDLAEAWVDKNYPKDHATKYEYDAKALTRRIGQEKRVDAVETICERYLGDKIILVGHSNGCDIITRLVARKVVRFHELHLIAAASEASFDKSGLNKALHNGYVSNKIVCYISPVDEALKKARLSTRVLGWMGLGFGYLGLVGPQDVDYSLKDRVEVVQRRFGHSTWFNKDHFDNTMRKITGVSV